MAKLGRQASRGCSLIWWAVLQKASLGGRRVVLVQEPRALLLDQPAPPERHLQFLPHAGSLCEEALAKSTPGCSLQWGRIRAAAL